MALVHALFLLVHSLGPALTLKKPRAARKDEHWRERP